jgi:hypothetical protein
MLRSQRIFSFLTVIAGTLIGLALPAWSQTEPQSPPTPPARPRVEIRVPPATPRIPAATGQTFEQKIMADSNVNGKFCVSEGRLKINGWERNEFRVFIRNGRKPAFRVLEKEAKSGKPSWLWVISAPEETTRTGTMSECLTGSTIEIDLPLNASLNITGRTSETLIDSVKKVSIKNVEGNIALQNIAGGIVASTYQGDLIVENSGGSISLDTNTGNIIAYDVTPGQIGDIFRAKTNSGAIALQHVVHRQIEASSISGSVLFSGGLLEGGIYNFRTANGAITLNLPASVSARIAASYGFGSFNSAIPINVTNETVSPGGKNIVGTIGKGVSTVNVTTSSGSIGIRKQN